MNTNHLESRNSPAAGRPLFEDLQASKKNERLDIFYYFKSYYFEDLSQLVHYYQADLDKKQAVRLPVAHVLLKEGQYKKAAAIFKKAILENNSPAFKHEARMNYALTFLLREKYADARLHYDSILETDPSDLSALQGKVIALLLEGKFEEAEKVLQESSLPDDFLHLLWGLSLLFQDQFDDALIKIKEAKILKKNNPLADKAKIMAYLLQRNIQEFLRRAIDFKNKYGEDYLFACSVGWITISLNKKNELIKEIFDSFLSALAINSKHSLARVGFGVSLVLDKRNSEAEPIFKRVLDDYPDNLHAQYQYGLVLFLQKKYSEAKRVFQPLMEALPDNYGPVNVYLKILFEIGEHENIDKFTAHLPKMDNVEEINRMVKKLIKRKKFLLAYEFSQLSYRLNPKNFAGALAYAKFLMRKENYAGAEQVFDEILAGDDLIKLEKRKTPSRLIKTLGFIAETKFHLGKFKEAEACCRNILNYAPDNLFALTLLEQILRHDQKSAEEANQLFRRIILIAGFDAKNPDIVKRVTQIFYALGEKEALQNFLDLPKKKTVQAVTFEQKAKLAREHHHKELYMDPQDVLARKRFVQWTNATDKAKNENSLFDPSFAYSILGYFYYCRRNTNKAEYNLKTALLYDPNDFFSLKCLTLHYDDCLKSNEAFKCAERAKKCNEKEFEKDHRLFLMYAEELYYRERYEDACTCYRKKLGISEDYSNLSGLVFTRKEATMLRNCGANLYKLKKYDLAVKFFEIAHKYKVLCRFDLYDYGRSLFKSENYVKSAEIFEKCLKFKSPPTGTKRYLERCKEKLAPAAL